MGFQRSLSDSDQGRRLNWRTESKPLPAHSCSVAKKRRPRVGHGIGVPAGAGGGVPDVCVVTLEEQPDEEHAFGPVAALVAEWRQLRAGSDQVVSRVERAQAAVRRWELEAELLCKFHLTLPPDTYPLDDGRRTDQVRWRREALEEAHRELDRARRARLMRRVVTLGLWRK